ncbi:MAG: hypothetical protein LBK04_05080 [Clostridiales Family XIII bacterium]|jgi:hypothetical protein|nr:hypothetical protein [Clostridiales Family XIII bacterium]
MKITIEVTSKEIADLAVRPQAPQAETNRFDTAKIDLKQFNSDFFDRLIEGVNAISVGCPQKPGAEESRPEGANADE